ncbi:pseudouridine synthase [Chloroflexota bacterium]
MDKDISKNNSLKLRQSGKAVDNTSIELLKALTMAGAGSRRRIADTIKQGLVQVNGEVVEDFSHPINIESDIVSIDGESIDIKPEKSTYLILNKPSGVTSTTSDEKGCRTVIDILPEKYRRSRLYPVGRLDKNSTGLLLLTNDGKLTYRLTHPKFRIAKEYLVYLNTKLKQEEKQMLEQGIKLEEGITSLAKIVEVDSVSPYNYSITIHEGRKRQVRRMFSALGYRVLALKRIRMGNLNLGNLRDGDIRELSVREVYALSPQ